MASLNVKMTELERKQIETEVERGHAMNKSDFIRQAIREKLMKAEA